MRKVLVIMALALAMFGAGSVWSGVAHPTTSRIHMMADVTPNVSGCGGSSSGFCG